MKDLDEITGAIVDAAMQIHRQLGSGLLESSAPPREPDAIAMNATMLVQKLCSDRNESERFKCFDYEELVECDKLNLDVFWLKDEAP